MISKNLSPNLNDELILSVHIGGAHITAALYSVSGKELIYSSYVRAPLSHRTRGELITQIWKHTIAEVTKNITISLAACIIAVPAALDPVRQRQMSQNYKTYAALRDLNIVDFFAELLGLSANRIKLVTPAEALLNAELSQQQQLSARSLMIAIGTDFNAAERLNGATCNLNWEFATFKSGLANDLFSSHSLTERYRQLTGISVMNAEQLIRLYRETASAKLVLNQYLTELMEFILIQTSGNQYDMVFIEGDLALAKPQATTVLSGYINPKLLHFIKPDKLALLTGGAAIMADDLMTANC